MEREKGVKRAKPEFWSTWLSFEVFKQKEELTKICSMVLSLQAI